MYKYRFWKSYGFRSCSPLMWAQFLCSDTYTASTPRNWIRVMLTCLYFWSSLSEMLQEPS